MSDTAMETMTIAQAINSGYHCAMENDDKIVILGEDIADPIGGVFKTTKNLSTKFGSDRVRSLGASSRHHDAREMTRLTRC